MRGYIWIVVIGGILIGAVACRSVPHSPSGETPQVAPAPPTGSTPLEPQPIVPLESATGSTICPPASVRLAQSDCQRLAGAVREVWRLVQSRDEPGLHDFLAQDNLGVSVEGYGSDLQAVFRWAAERGKDAEILSVEVSDRKSYSTHDLVSIHTATEIFLIHVRISDGKVGKILIGTQGFLNP